MSSQSWNAIPAARREALAARQRQRIKEDCSDEDDDEFDKANIHTYIYPLSKKSGEWSSGSSGGYATEKNTNTSSSQESEAGEEGSSLLEQHSVKLESLETRIEKLLVLNEKMEERSKKLEQLVVQVAEHVGVRHSLGDDGGAAGKI
ncbi:hypothetical protein M6B38_128150 [Iris pallida]|uniref:Uncharacterized protein n=1 Tax=Iris pallida TaxID=29817 RepID=A0AAX6G6G2_IRIPA|nr:hypothetical protein M6B38_128150 [Iris pallida]